MTLLSWMWQHKSQVEVKEIVAEIEKETARLNGAAQNLSHEVKIVRKARKESRDNLQQALDEILAGIGKKR